MSRSRWHVLFALPLLLGACSVGPTQADIERDIEAQLQSVGGAWAGMTADGSLTLTFRLVESGATQVTGTGTMQERGASGSRAITVSGTYQRPTLTLAFDGLVYEGRAVRATVGGSYASVGGVSGTLVLAGEGYERRLGILLQETGP